MRRSAIAVLDVLLWAMIAYEHTFVYDKRRYRLRHGLSVDIPGSRADHPDHPAPNT